MINQLNSGYIIPQIALGTFKLTDEEVLSEVLDEAGRLGYSHIDTAKIYKNEHIIGKWISKNRRGDLFITTKLWNDDHDHVIEALDTSLEKLKTEYVDLYLVHWPVSTTGPFDIEKVWKQMEKAVELKKARSIGVSNFGIKNLTKLLSFCKIKPAVNQIELHPYFPQHEIREFCKNNDIQVEAYSTFGSGETTGLTPCTDPIINEIADEYSISPQQVILSFLIGEGLIVLPRTSSKTHLRENKEMVQLKSEDIEKIKSIKTRMKYIKCKSFGESRFD